jgi:hypothetical protein
MPRTAPVDPERFVARHFRELTAMAGPPMTYAWWGTCLSVAFAVEPPLTGDEAKAIIEAYNRQVGRERRRRPIAAS